jgi:hypothetical protein
MRASLALDKWILCLYRAQVFIHSASIIGVHQLEISIVCMELHVLFFQRLLTLMEDSVHRQYRGQSVVQDFFASHLKEIVH